jgi:predicted  nucleic acid-binding Zn-ribbon protein
MNPFEMVVAIIVIVTIGSVIKARLGIHKDKDGNERFHRADPAVSADAARLRDEVRALKERVQVLERVITDSETSSLRLEREIDALRDRNPSDQGGKQ